MRKLLMGFTAFIAMFAVIAAAVLAQWKFANTDYETKSVSVAQDDLKLNNVTNNISKTYTVYFFPSAIYLNDYYDYLTGTSAVKPEEKYGYIYPEFDDNGNVSTDDDGNTVYGCEFAEDYDGGDYNGGDGAYVGSISTQNGDYTQLLVKDGADAFSQWIYLGSQPDGWDTSCVCPTNLIFPGTTAQASNTSIGYRVNAGNNNYSGNMCTDWDGILTYYDFDKQTTGYIPKYLVGDPELDNSTANTALMTVTDSTLYEGLCGRNQHLYDRFGSWKYVEYGAGRYMPLKITVDDSFSYSKFAEVMKSPISSMGDSNDYFNLYFSEWAYVDVSGSSYELPVYASDTEDAGGRVTNAFRAYDLGKYFDIVQNLDKYADGENVVRLFPVFSNGKNYSSVNNANTGLDSSDTENYNEWLSKGGGDLVETVEKSSSSDEKLYDSSHFLTFSTDYVSSYTNAEQGTYDSDGNFTATKTGVEVTNIKYATYSNLNLSKITEIEILIQATNGSRNWEGTSYDVHTFTEDDIKAAIASYGKNLYNVYVFVGWSGQYGENDAAYSLENIVYDARDTQSDYFSSLSGKDLEFVDSYYIKCVNGSSQDCYRCVAVAIEKVRDVKIITGLNDGNGDLLTLGQDSTIQETYAASNATFGYTSETLYSITAGKAIAGNVVDESAISATHVNEQFPYILYYGGVDFNSIEGDYFQLRFGEEYLNNRESSLAFRGLAGSANTENEEYRDSYNEEHELANTDYAVTVGPNVSLVTTKLSTAADSTESTVYGNVYTNPFGADGYFEAEYGSDESGNKQLFFKVKEGCEGVYDFLIVYIPETIYTAADGSLISEAAYNSDTSSNYKHLAGYYIFAQRQSSVGVRIVTHDLDADSEGFVSIEGQVPFTEENPDGTLLFQKQYFMDEVVSSEDHCDMHSDETLAEAVNNYVGYFLANNTQYTIEDIILRDHVTSAVVACYIEVDSDFYEEWVDSHSEAEAAKYFYTTEDGKYYKMTFNGSIVISKNYIFYVTVKSAEVTR